MGILRREHEHNLSCARMFERYHFPGDNILKNRIRQPLRAFQSCLQKQWLNQQVPSMQRTWISDHTVTDCPIACHTAGRWWLLSKCFRYLLLNRELNWRSELILMGNGELHPYTLTEHLDARGN